MRFDLSYGMQIAFSPAIRQHQYLLRLLPRADRYVCEQLHLNIDQQAFDLSRVQYDGFGNALVSGQQLPEHQQFSVQLQATLSTRSPADALILPPRLFAQYTSLTYLSEQQQAGWLSDSPRQASDLAQATMLMTLVFERMTYIAGQTLVHHPVAHLLENPQGVCQDYAHLLISLLRSCGIPARYVAGVAQGEGESHAWVEAWIEAAWIGLDPTHHVLITPDMPYVAFALGRDSHDCALNSGSFVGQTQQSLQVQAQLMPLSHD
jgi:transglutaminase-like putative cysteine protease